MKYVIATLLDYACSATHPVVWRLGKGCWLLDECPGVRRLWRWAS